MKTNSVLKVCARALTYVDKLIFEGMCMHVQRCILDANMSGTNALNITIRCMLPKKYNNLQKCSETMFGNIAGKKKNVLLITPDKRVF